MARIPYFDINGNLTVQVELKNASDVFLVDSQNYRKFQSGQAFKYVGGHYDRSPVTLNVSGSGRWYLIVSHSDYTYKHN